MLPTLPPASAPPATTRATAAPAPPPPREQELMRVARELETTFLAEMLKSAGLGKAPQAFGGGAGEGQFASFLVHEQARGMVAAGGIGLAQSIFEAMRDRG